jgi:AcrR family transcriptional regulator
VARKIARKTMPYPTQIHYEALIETASRLIETHGVENVSLRMLADELGVKAPSLYRHVTDKNALLRAVNEATLRHLFQTLYQALESPEPTRSKLVTLAHEYRRFAQEQPITYELAFRSVLALRPDEELQEQAALPIQQIFSELTGEADALTALRGALALLHGWMTLEINGNFRRGGDLNVAFNRVVEAYYDGWQNS